MSSNLITNVERAKQILAVRLKKAREERNVYLSNKKISKLTEISPSHIDGIMRGDSIPSLEKLFRIAVVLETDPLKVLDSLEAIIKPVGFSVDKWDAIEKREYYKQAQLILHEVQRDLAENLSIEGGKTFRFESGSFTMEDNYMSSDGMPKGSKVYWYRDEDEPINGKIYLLVFGKEAYVRRIWKYGSKVLLIPSFIEDESLIMEREFDEIKIVGVPYKVEIDL